MPISPTTRRYPETQGDVCVDDPTFVRPEPWLWFTPALCAATTGLGTALASPVILGALMLVAEFGAIFPTHPFDLIYDHGLRRLTGTRPLPRNDTSRRIAYGVMAVWLAATTLAFGLELPLPGYLLGGALTSAAAIASVAHFPTITGQRENSVPQRREQH